MYLNRVFLKKNIGLQHHFCFSSSTTIIEQSNNNIIIENNNNSRLNALRQTLQSEKQKASTSSESSLFVRVESTGKLPRKSDALPKPSWLRIQPTQGEQLENYKRLKATVKDLKLATVCEEAKCPNIGECWGGGKEKAATATIMVGGELCTRACRFCSVKTSLTPPPLEPEEPKRVAKAIADWGLSYVVLTSVDRDDLPDHGVNHFANTVRYLRELKKEEILIEFLTPDFGGNFERIAIMANSGLNVYAHNVETVQRLQSRVRDRRANYKQSLFVLESALKSNPSLITKTSIMLGLGETVDEVKQAMWDCFNSGVSVITFGQYLRPSKGHLPVMEYITPTAFEELKNYGEQVVKFKYVASGPLVRSSYKAGEFYLENLIKQRKQQQQ